MLMRSSSRSALARTAAATAANPGTTGPPLTAEPNARLTVRTASSTFSCRMWRRRRGELHRAARTDAGEGGGGELGVVGVGGQPLDDLAVLVHEMDVERRVQIDVPVRRGERAAQPAGLGRAEEARLVVRDERRRGREPSGRPAGRVGEAHRQAVAAAQYLPSCRAVRDWRRCRWVAVQ
ncbi:hypothetical protein GCM10023074_37000 [Microbispora amethystogenes]|uniref:Uncharacterized protein n=2 Tax=Microbispora amethystogenes TaxID=1427754 RepID=A0ABQ4FBR9_9ACTN|nr:hypothetical protein Mam01_24180 [Microbispora amethystogenes]